MRDLLSRDRERGVVGRWGVALGGSWHQSRFGREWSVDGEGGKGCWIWG